MLRDYCDSDCQYAGDGMGIGLDSPIEWVDIALDKINGVGKVCAV